MRPDKINNSQEDLLKSRLSNQLNLRHELLVLSSHIPWDKLEEEFADLCPGSEFVGRPAKPVRLILGLLLLQHIHNLSDAEVVRNWVENPYWQYFCGFDFLQWALPVHPSSLTRWRKRLGEERLERLLSVTVKVAIDTGTIERKDLETVVVDTTVMEKNIEYPTDTKLLEKARSKLVSLAQKHNLVLRQNYNFVAKKLSRKIGGYLHAKQMKRAKKAQKELRTIVGRVMRDCARKIEGNMVLESEFRTILSQTKHLLERKVNDKHKLYSLHEPDVECIAKGKAHKRYEFGAKVSLAIAAKKGRAIIASAQALPGNPYDGHTLRGALAHCNKITGIEVSKAFVDKGYKGHGVEGAEVYVSGQKRGVTTATKKQMKRRQAIEPHIGHMKNKLKLGLCRLKGIVGNVANVLLCAAAYNLRLVINRLRFLLFQILAGILEPFLENYA